jgi:hypothetical protein
MLGLVAFRQQSINGSLGHGYPLVRSERRGPIMAAGLPSAQCPTGTFGVDEQHFRSAGPGR